nr:MAG TPA: hypothetical protein [Bacteriophage sp.]
MGIVLLLAFIFALCFAASMIHETDSIVSALFLVLMIGCLVVVFTMLLSIKDTCETYGKFSVGSTLYQCQQIQEDK